MSISEASPEPKVSVITPLYNSTAFIRGTLDSLLAQTYTNWECILIDDGSTDDTAAVVKPYLSDPRFNYVGQKNRGIAGARNTGIAAATGEWVCLLDHDDRWLPQKLERQMRFSLTHNFDISCTEALIVTKADRWVYTSGFDIAFADVPVKLKQSITDRQIDIFELLIRVNFICTGSVVMIRKSLFDELGLFDPKCVPADDYDMWLRCIPGTRIGFLSEPLVEYVVHDRNYSKNLVRILEYTIRVLQRHRRCHITDTRRRRQFDEALAHYFGLFFRQASQDRSRSYALLRTFWLLKGGPCMYIICVAARAVVSAAVDAWARFTLRAKTSATYRWELLRAWKRW